MTYLNILMVNQKNITINKNANYIVDLYSSYTYRKYSKSKIIKKFDFELKNGKGIILMRE